MNEQGALAITHFEMLHGGETVVVGLSGGADSIALLHFLRTLAPTYSLTLVACHINHYLRGKASLADAQYVKRICAQWNVPLHLHNVHIAALAKQNGQSVELCAREERYRFFAKVAATYGPTCKIATAHHAGDNAETILYNLTRGGGLKGLCGIPPVRGNIIRPLILCTRAQIEAYCAQHNLEYVTDATNADDRYTRNALRLHVLPRLRQINPALDHTLAQMSMHLRQDDAFLQSAAQQAYAACQSTHGTLNRKAFLAQHTAMQSRILLRLITQAGAAPAAKTVALCAQIVQAGSGAQELVRGQYFYANAHVLGVRTQTPNTPQGFCYSLSKADFTPNTPPRELLCGSRMLRIWVEQAPSLEKINKCPYKNALDYARIEDVFCLRSRQSGDRISLPHRGISKSLKKLYHELQIPPPLRDSMAVVADAGGLCWAEAAGASARALPNAQTAQLLRIECVPNGEDE